MDTGSKDEGPPHTKLEGLRADLRRIASVLGLRSLFDWFGHLRRLLVDRNYRGVALLARIPRYRPTRIELYGKPFEIVDSVSFQHMYMMVFERGVYSFAARSESPRIIDGGANVGTSVLFFKRLYPESSLLAFEPDPDICETLRRNVASQELEQVEVRREALWSGDGEFPFWREGADAGRLAPSGDESQLAVPTVRLRSLLTEEVDFLKLDIEGAETEVLIDARDRLHRVENLFVEYHSFDAEVQRLDELLAVIKEAGFRVQIESSSSNRMPFRIRRSYLGMDLQLDIYGYRS